jgi:hypothetical protein
MNNSTVRALPTGSPERCLHHAFERFCFALELRLQEVMGLQRGGTPNMPDMPAMEVPAREDEPYGQFVQEHGLDRDSQLLLLLTLAPWIEPGFFDRILQTVQTGAGEYPQFGGIRGKQHRGFLPTGDTALLLLAGNDLAQRLRWQRLLTSEHPLIQKQILSVEDTADGDPPMSGRLVIDSDIADRLIYGKARAPRLSLKFPAQRLETGMEWDDLVLPPRTVAEIRELEAWVRHGEVLMDEWKMRRKLRPGFRALFHGPPGTGKTVTASVLGKMTDREVYRVDLSMVVSKYIGETEKNLAALFDKAEHKEWILFFDEADSLFGKRTQVREAHDRYANQEVSFLLQRIENFNGLVVLASNFAGNVDEAFARRFELLVHFPMPRQGERLLLWKKGLPGVAELEPGVDLSQLAARHEMSGGMIMNVIRFVSMEAIARGERMLRQRDFVEGIRREFSKENRLV